MSGFLPRWIRALSTLLVVQLTVACHGSARPDKGPVVLAAASLQESLSEAATAWAREGHPAPRLSFAATSALARQVEQGAPADLFVSADEDWMDKLDHARLLKPGSRADLLGNALVVVAPRGAKVRALAALGDGTLALADPAAVPAGKYAKAALMSLLLWPKVEKNVVPAENVRAALALVERGEATLGIVYATDALASNKVEVVETLPEASHPPIRYPVAMLAASKNPDADAFRQFLFSSPAVAIFHKHGFILAR